MERDNTLGQGASIRETEETNHSVDVRSVRAEPPEQQRRDQSFGMSL